MAINNTIHKIEFTPRRHIIYGAKFTIDTTLKTVDGEGETVDLTNEITIL